MTRTEWNTKEEKIQQDFLWALGSTAKHQITRSEYSTESAEIKDDKLIKLFNRYYLRKGIKDGRNKQTEKHWNITRKN